MAPVEEISIDLWVERIPRKILVARLRTIKQWLQKRVIVFVGLKENVATRFNEIMELRRPERGTRIDINNVTTRLVLQSRSQTVENIV